MEDKDIVGREFTVFKYDKFKQISWESEHDECIGSKGVVRNIHPKYPEYANIDLIRANGRKTQKHFPTHLVREQIEKEDNTTVDDLLVEMKQLISRL